MKPLFKCELKYFPHTHLMQIYTGFQQLKAAGLVHLSIKKADKIPVKPLLEVRVDDRIDIVYDTMDGYNWISGSIEDNLEFFKNNISAHFYFKRSYNREIRKFAPQNCRVYPLGINYHIMPEGRDFKSVREIIREIIKNNSIAAKIFDFIGPFYSRDFECPPFIPQHAGILFLTRLWDPEDEPLDYLKEERRNINRKRIEFVKACRKEFGDIFRGGIRADEFSLRRSGELVMPYRLTNKNAFLDSIKKSAVCIATTGLHGSINWKFGEYVAASRAVISEPLLYQVPGRFERGVNYLEFRKADELVDKISGLRSDREKLFEIMCNNFYYYHTHLRPDMLVLNTLLKIHSSSLS